MQTDDSGATAQDQKVTMVYQSLIILLKLYKFLSLFSLPSYIVDVVGKQ